MRSGATTAPISSGWSSAPRDERQAVAAAQQGREELETMLRLDRTRREREQVTGWGP